jgi:hypothetical protein
VSESEPSLADRRALLEQYLPRIRYDSHEAFFADGAGEMLENPAFEPARGPEDLEDPAGVIASHGHGPGRLNAAFVRPGAYSNGQPFRAGDCLRSINRAYRAQARELHPRYANVAYGHTSYDDENRHRKALIYRLFEAPQPGFEPGFPD